MIAFCPENGSGNISAFIWPLIHCIVSICETLFILEDMNLDSIRLTIDTELDFSALSSTVRRDSFLPDINSEDDYAFVWPSIQNFSALHCLRSQGIDHTVKTKFWRRWLVLLSKIRAPALRIDLVLDFVSRSSRFFCCNDRENMSWSTLRPQVTMFVNPCPRAHFDHTINFLLTTD